MHTKGLILLSHTISCLMVALCCQFSALCYLVMYSFFLEHTNVSQNTFLGLFWPMGLYISHGMRMTVASMFYVLIATPLGSHGGSCHVVYSGHPPHIVTHLIHVNSMN
jgi:hypothetical protein